MKIKDIIKSKKEYREYEKRVKSLPKDYQIVYKEIQKYVYKVGDIGLSESMILFSNIIEFFEEGVALGKGVLEVTGEDVAAFCDELIKNLKPYDDIEK